MFFDGLDMASQNCCRGAIKLQQEEFFVSQGRREDSHLSPDAGRIGI